MILRRCWRHWFRWVMQWDQECSGSCAQRSWRGDFRLLRQQCLRAKSVRDCRERRIVVGGCRWLPVVVGSPCRQYPWATVVVGKEILEWVVVACRPLVLPQFRAVVKVILGS